MVNIQHKMENNMKEIITLIKNTDLEHLHGLMVKSKH